MKKLDMTNDSSIFFGHIKYFNFPPTYENCSWEVPFGKVEV